jgi:hypothetical protein
MAFNIAISIAAGITHDVSCIVVIEIPVFYSSEPHFKIAINHGYQEKYSLWFPSVLPGKLRDAISK